MFGDLDSHGLAALRREPERWLPAALDIARGHGLPCADPLVFAGGTNLVVGLGGELIAEVQRVPPGELVQLEPQWEPFIDKQIAGCRAHHERLGLPAKFLAGLDDYVREAAPLIPRRISPVILTGEYIPENFILRRDASGWQLAGLIDFGDVMTGWGLYDVLGPGVFLAEGRPERVRRLLRGFGYTDADMDGALSHRLFALCLLHRFSDPLRQFRIEGWRRRAGTLQELERLIWPI